MRPTYDQPCPFILTTSMNWQTPQFDTHPMYIYHWIDHPTSTTMCTSSRVKMIRWSSLFHNLRTFVNLSILFFVLDRHVFKWVPHVINCLLAAWLLWKFPRLYSCVFASMLQCAVFSV